MDLAKNLSLLIAALVLLASAGFMVVEAVTVIEAILQVVL